MPEMKDFADFETIFADFESRTVQTDPPDSERGSGG